LHISLNICEPLGTVTVNHFKGCFYSSLSLRKQRGSRGREGLVAPGAQPVRLQDSLELVWRPHFPASAPPKGSSGGWRQQDYPPHGCLDFRELSDLFCPSKRQLFPRTVNCGRKLLAAYMQDVRNIAWKRCL